MGSPSGKRMSDIAVNMHRTARLEIIRSAAQAIILDMHLEVSLSARRARIEGGCREASLADRALGIRRAGAKRRRMSAGLFHTCTIPCATNNFREGTTPNHGKREAHNQKN